MSPSGSATLHREGTVISSLIGAIVLIRTAHAQADSDTTPLFVTKSERDQAQHCLDELFATLSQLEDQVNHYNYELLGDTIGVLGKFDKTLEDFFRFLETQPATNDSLLRIESLLRAIQKNAKTTVSHLHRSYPHLFPDADDCSQPHRRKKK